MRRFEVCVRISRADRIVHYTELASVLRIYHRDFLCRHQVFNTQIGSKDSKLVIPIPGDKSCCGAGAGRASYEHLGRR